MRKSLVIFILFYFSFCNSQCPCTSPPSCNCPPVPKDRCKRETLEKKVYPHPGTWYIDKVSGKAYYNLGKMVYVQRKEPAYYSKWVTSGDGADWALSDNYLWTWDQKGRWYTPREDEGCEFSDDDTKFKLPIKCVGTECPDQIRFPSKGIWYIYGGKYIFKEDLEGKRRYEKQDNGKFSKFIGDVKICPDHWAWNHSTGLWYPIEDSGSSSCQKEESVSIPEQNRLFLQHGPTGEREGILKPPRKVFDY